MADREGLSGNLLLRAFQLANPINEVRKDTGVVVVANSRNERIQIGDDISVVISDIRGGKVLIGIEAPRHVRVQRDEIAGRDNRDDRQESAA